MRGFPDFKRISIKIDDNFFKGFLRRFLSRGVNAERVRRFETKFNYRINIYYSKNLSNEISILCDKYGSDKGEISPLGHPYPWPSHSYSDYYSHIFSNHREGVKRVFECGLGTNNLDVASSMGAKGMPGASLRVWRDYFPNAIVYGADIDRDVLFDEKRIKTFYMDQLDTRSISDFWREVGETDFDFMLDDGLHTFEAGVTLFENSIRLLSDTGVYIIEDVSARNLLRYEEFFSQFDYLVEYVTLHRPNLPLQDNNLIVIRKP